MVDVNLQGGYNWMCSKHFHAVTQESVHHMMNKMMGVRSAGPIAAAEHSRAGLAVLGTGRIDKMSQMRLEKPGRVEWDQDTHNPRRCPIHGAPIVPARNTDVRTMILVGEERQGGKTRRSGDACDSLVL